MCVTVVPVEPQDLSLCHNSVLGRHRGGAFAPATGLRYVRMASPRQRWTDRPQRRHMGPGGLYQRQSRTRFPKVAETIPTAIWTRALYGHMGGGGGACSTCVDWVSGAGGAYWPLATDPCPFLSFSRGRLWKKGLQKGGRGGHWSPFSTPTPGGGAPLTGAQNGSQRGLRGGGGGRGAQGLGIGCGGRKHIQHQRARLQQGNSVLEP